MRADRLLTILFHLQVERRLTARELARRLEVSERTIHRDMEALSISGVPVVAERGANGGWGLLEPFRTNLTGLNHAEVRTLFVGLPARILADLGLRQAADGALAKLLAALPSTARADAELSRQRIYVDTAGWNAAAEDATSLTAIQQAVWDDRRIRVRYRRALEGEVERVLEPLGLVAKGSAWYMVASSDGQIRTYRVSRFVSVEPLESSFERPAGFDLGDHWRSSTAEFDAKLPRFFASVRVAPASIVWLRLRMRGGRIESEVPADADGFVTFRLRFDSEEEASIFILGLGDGAEMLEPESLRSLVIDRARRAVAFYEELDRSRRRRKRARSSAT